MKNHSNLIDSYSLWNKHLYVRPYGWPTSNKTNEEGTYWKLTREGYLVYIIQISW